MLQTSTVERRTYELLKKLMKDDFLSDFLLAGGTNLALQIGHRRSIDFDTTIDLINSAFSWKKIEKRIRAMIKYENRVFETAP